MFGDARPTSKLVIDWIRHGEPEGGVKYRGSLDDPLSELGWQQLRSSVEQAQAAGARWDAVISSPMRRCQAFAREVADQQDLPLILMPDLRELCFGELEGMTPSEAWVHSPGLLRKLWLDPEGHTPPGGEPFGEFIARVKTGIDQLLAQFSDQHILVVAHGGVIRAMLTACFHFSPRDTFCIEVPYAGMTRTKAYRHEDGSVDFSLAFINGFTPQC